MDVEKLLTPLEVLPQGWFGGEVRVWDGLHHFFELRAARDGMRVPMAFVAPQTEAQRAMGEMFTDDLLLGLTPPPRHWRPVTRSPEPWCRACPEPSWWVTSS